MTAGHDITSASGPPPKQYQVRWKFWAVVRDRAGDEIGRVEGMTREEVEKKAETMAGEPVDFVWSDQAQGRCL